MSVPYSTLLKSTKNFKLYKTSSTNKYSSYLITRTLELEDDVNILKVNTEAESKETYLISCGSNIQDYIIDFDLYSELISLVDTAFDLSKSEVI